LAAWLLTLIVTVAVVNRGKFAADTVFFGDSLTEEWDMPAVNFGGYGNTTDQMLPKFDEVTEGQFMRAVILGGTNDVLQGVDPEKTIANLHEMIRRSTEAQLETFVCTLPPILRDNGKYNAAVDALNTRIKQEVQDWNANGTKVVLVDYNKVLRGRPDAYSGDGVHLRGRGYLRVELQLLRTRNFFLWKHGHRFPPRTNPLLQSTEAPRTKDSQ
jgi:hypothetical protein